MPANIQQLAGFKLETQRRVWSATPSYQVYTWIMVWSVTPSYQVFTQIMVWSVTPSYQVFTQVKVLSVTPSYQVFTQINGLVSYLAVLGIVSNKRGGQSTTPSYHVLFLL